MPSKQAVKKDVTEQCSKGHETFPYRVGNTENETFLYRVGNAENGLGTVGKGQFLFAY